MADSSEDYYDILGVAKTATKDELRKAYRKLSRQYHPDANPGDDAALNRFKDVQRAWEVLGDDEKRKNYDQYGHPDGPRFKAGAGAGPGGGGGWSWSSSEGGDVPFDIEELFSGFRARGGRSAGAGTQAYDWPMRGHDIRAKLEVPFMLAAEGGRYDLQLQRSAGADSETLTVNIPAGIDSGTTIRLAGQGTPGASGGQPGDLLVTITVGSHPWFRRDGTSVLLDVPISITECALGTKVDIPTLRDGTVTLTIPPGTSSGGKLRLKGKGIRDRRTAKHGDMFAVIKVMAPKDLSHDARKLLSSLNESLTENPRSGLWTSSR